MGDILRGHRGSFHGRRRGVLGPHTLSPPNSQSNHTLICYISSSYRFLLKWSRWYKRAEKPGTRDTGKLGFYPPVPSVGFLTLSPVTSLPASQQSCLLLSTDSHLTLNSPHEAILTQPAHRVQSCAHSPVRGSLVGTHSGTRRPHHRRTGLRSGRGTGWYRCAHL